MIPAGVGFGLKAIPEAMRTVTGIVQMIRGNRMLDNLGPRPEYEIPGAYRESVDTARNLAASSNVPGQSIKEQRLGEVAATNIQAAKETAGDSASLAGIMAGIMGSQMDAQNALNIEGANMQNDNLKNLMTVLEMYGRQQEKQWELNELSPYMDALAAASALRQGGMTNMFEGVRNAASIGGEAIDYANIRGAVSNKGNRVGSPGVRTQAGGVLSDKPGGNAFNYINSGSMSGGNNVAQILSLIGMLNNVG